MVVPVKTSPYLKGRKEGNVLFNDTLNTCYLLIYGVGHMVKDYSDNEEGRKVYLMIHSTHFIYSYMVKDHSDNEEGRKVYLTIHSTHFIYSYMV